MSDRLRETLNACLLLFAKDHAIDRMNWAASFLRTQDIRELNELPIAIRGALASINEYEKLHPAANYYEELGSVLWWHLPICEPPAVARFVDEIDGHFNGGYPDGWHTHFSRIPIVWGSDGQAKHPIVGIVGEESNE